MLSSINVPVGLLGLAKKTIFVLLLHFLSILSTSANLLVSFALIVIAPLNEAEILFPQSIWAPKSALMAAYSYYIQDYYGDAIAE